MDSAHTDQAWMSRPVFVAGVALSALPWLNPFAAGPSPTVVPWLVSFACGALLWLFAARLGSRLPPLFLVAFLVLLAWPLATHATPGLEALAWTGALALLLLSTAIAGAPGLLAGAQVGTLAAAALSAVYALLQYFGASAALGPWVSYAAAGEAYANLRQPNQFATLCAIGMALALWSGLSLPRAARLSLVVLLAAASAASVSRTGLLEVAVLGLVAALFRGDGRRERVLLASTAGLAYLAASWLLPEMLELATGSLPARTLWGRLGGAGEGCSSRSLLWSNVMHLIALRPWAGWGLGELDYAHFSTLYEGPRFCEILDNAHNLPLQFAVELGLPLAVVASAAIVFWVVRQRPWSELQPQRQLAWALLAMIGVHSLLEYPLWYGPFQITCGLALGMLVPTRKTVALRGAMVAALATSLGAAVGYVAWDYTRVSQVYLPAEQRAVIWRADPLAAAQQSWLFAGQAQFAALTLTTPTRENAAGMLASALQLLHYSPEPRVIERAIESAVYLGRDEEATQLLSRYKAAFPREALAWSRRDRTPVQD